MAGISSEWRMFGRDTPGRAKTKNNFFCVDTARTETGSFLTAQVAWGDWARLNRTRQQAEGRSERLFAANMTIPAGNIEYSSQAYP